MTNKQTIYSNKNKFDYSDDEILSQVKIDIIIYISGTWYIPDMCSMYAENRVPDMYQQICLKIKKTRFVNYLSIQWSYKDATHLIRTVSSRRIEWDMSHLFTTTGCRDIHQNGKWYSNIMLNCLRFVKYLGIQWS